VGEEDVFFAVVVDEVALLCEVCGLGDDGGGEGGGQHNFYFPTVVVEFPHHDA